MQQAPNTLPESHPTAPSSPNCARRRGRPPLNRFENNENTISSADTPSHLDAELPIQSVNNTPQGQPSTSSHGVTESSIRAAPKPSRSLLDHTLKENNRQPALETRQASVLPSPALTNETSPAVSTRNISPMAPNTEVPSTKFDRIAEPYFALTRDQSPEIVCTGIVQTSVNPTWQQPSSVESSALLPVPVPGPTIVQSEACGSGPNASDSESQSKVMIEDDHRAPSTSSASQDKRPIESEDEEPGQPRKRCRLSPNDVNKAMFDCVSMIDARSAEFDRWSAPGLEIVHARCFYLRNASLKQDVFYILLHQLFCLWSLDPEAVCKFLPKSEPEALRRAFGTLLQILRDNGTMPNEHLVWFSRFPSPINLDGYKLSFPNVLPHIGSFLDAFDKTWDRLLSISKYRTFPVTSHELFSVLRCPSGTLQGILFTFNRRVINIPDNVAKELDNLFHVDRGIEAEMFKSMVAGGYSEDIAQRQRREIAAKYKEAAERATAKSSKKSYLPFNTIFLPSPGSLLIRVVDSTAPSAIPQASQQQISNQGKQAQTTTSTAPASNVRRAVRPQQHTQQRSIAPMSQFPPNGNTPSILDNFALPIMANRCVSQASSRGNALLYHPQATAGGMPPHGYAPNGSPFTQQSPVLSPQGQSFFHSYSAEAAYPSRNIRSSQDLSAAQAGTQMPYGTHPSPQQNQPYYSALHNPPQSVEQQFNSSQTLYASQTGQGTATSPHQQTRHLFGVRPPGTPGYTVTGAGTPNGRPIATPVSSNRTTVVPTGRQERLHPGSPYDWASHQAAAHLPQLRSPKRKPAEMMSVSSRYFQFVAGFAVKPTRFPALGGLRSFGFTLSADDLAKVSDKITDETGLEVRKYFDGSCRYRLRLVMRPDSETEVTEANWVTYPSHWPKEIYSSFNEKTLMLPRKQHFYYDLPLELSDYMVEGRNVAKLSFPGVAANFEQGKTYFVAVEVVKTLSLESIKRMLNEPEYLFRDTKSVITNRLKPPDTDDILIEDNSLCINLADPFTSIMFKVPAKGVDCKHLECFDLDTWLVTRPRKPGKDNPLEPSMVDRWKCPICGGDARPVSLRIDDFLVGVRRDLLAMGKGQIKKIQVGADGSWTPLAEPDDSEDETEGGHVNAVPGARGPSTASRAPEVIDLSD